MPSHPEYEYGIVYRLFPNDIHRGPFTKEEAEDWIAEWIEDGGKPDAFSIVRRLVSPWEPISDPQVEIPEIGYVNIVPEPKRSYE